MPIRWVGYIFVFLVSVQTYAAMADVYHSHQSQEDHLEVQHQDEDAGIAANQLSDSSDSVTNAFDCQHCCHCHSCHTHILIRENLPSQNFAYDSHPAGSVNPAQIGILNLPYRPPRV